MLPLVVSGAARTRTGRDRLEVLTALMAAPTFDPLFRQDVVVVPRDHPVYGWGCSVPGCERSESVRHDYCNVHVREWRAMREAGGSVAEFLRTAAPLKAVSWLDWRSCLICPELPAKSGYELCYLHADSWFRRRGYLRRTSGKEISFAEWVAGQEAFGSFGPCQVPVCTTPAEHPVGLCSRHWSLYGREGRPGEANLPPNWRRWLSDRDKPIPVTYGDELAFRRWCQQAGPIHRMNGVVSLRGLRPLVKAEIQWAMFHHTQVPIEGGLWPLLWIQYLADYCRTERVDSLADLEAESLEQYPRQVARRMLEYLRLVYFTRQDTKDAGFIETDHYGVRFTHRGSHIDMTRVSQRWLRDLLWEWMAGRLATDPPRSRNPFDIARRGCVELSAFLEAHVPGGGHDPTALTGQHMLDFVADQRHRARHGLKALGIHGKGGPGAGPATVTMNAVARNFNGARTVLREAMDTGRAERIGLGRAFIVALPHGGAKGGRRRPFPDEVARALADEDNLRNLESFDIADRGMRDIWEALVVTGRRCGEVLDVRLECISRLNGLPMFWHDQTKVGNYDEAIRIPERLYQRIEKRQAKTIDRFIQRHGRPPTPEERRKIALFPRKTANRDLIKGSAYSWFNGGFRDWVDTLDIAHCVPHQARHTLATNLLRHGANLAHVKRYLGQVSERMAEHYVHLANTDPRLEDALNAVWVAGPGTAQPGAVLSGAEPMTREEAQSLAIDLTRTSTPAEGGFCTFQPVVNGDACPFNLDCHNCDKFVLSGADLIYWRRKREQWRVLAERAADSATADYLQEVFEPTARAIDGLERALEALGLLDDALALDLRRPQDFFGRVWNTAFRAGELAAHETTQEAL